MFLPPKDDRFLFLDGLPVKRERAASVGKGTMVLAAVRCLGFVVFQHFVTFVTS